MAFKGRRFRDKKKLFTGIMCVGFGAFFYWYGFSFGFTASIIIFGALFLYFGIRSLILAR